MGNVQPLPAGGPGREAAALIEIEHTVVSPLTVRLLLAFFLTAIAVVPMVELTAARTGAPEGIAAAWSHVSRVPDEIRSYVDQTSDAERLRPRRAEDMGIRGEVSATGTRRGWSAAASDLWARLIEANHIVLTGLSGFERALENASTIGAALRIPAQFVMTRWLGAGNERVYPGRERWLFYREDVDYITEHGFLDSAEIKRRIAAAPAWTTPPQPDPREAIVAFNDDLAARGIALIVMPTPVKPGVHPEMLARRYAEAEGVLHNASYREFVEHLERRGVRVFHASEALAAARLAAPQYLAADTHWRPEAMELVAEQLAALIAATVPLPASPDPGYRIERSEASNVGDMARMLDLPDDSRLFPPESVWLRRVLPPDGHVWRSSRDGDVLLLGDSFSNIYSLASMGWGTSAGFAEQLAYALRRPIDRIVQNDEGAFATRAMLQREPARLDGKRVVIYQFAARELAAGDWKVIALGER
jgi:alginate O-acetyltransferase complex protein AlgJ